jgi:site-specific recombinase XerD
MYTPIQQWADYMKFTGSAETTVACRTRMMRRLERDYGDPLALTKSDLVRFLSAYGHPSTRSTMLSYLRAFYGWALTEQLVEADPTEKIPGVRVPSGSPHPAPHDDVVALLHSAKPRTRIMVLLMVYAGLRCCEVADFRPEHLTQNSDGAWWLWVPRGKGGKAASVPFPSDIAAEVKAAPAWRVTTQTVQRDVSKAMKAVGSSATPHHLRHYYGTTALQSTQNLRKVQDMMRHASPATTARYTKVSASELTEAAEGLPRIA